MMNTIGGIATTRVTTMGGATMTHVVGNYTMLYIQFRHVLVANGRHACLWPRRVHATAGCESRRGLGLISVWGVWLSRL